MLQYLLELQDGERKTGKRIVEFILQLHVHNGSSSDTSTILNNLPGGCRLVDLIKNGKGIISLKVFNGYKQGEKLQTIQYLFFRCSMTQLN